MRAVVECQSMRIGRQPIMTLHSTVRWIYCLVTLALYLLCLQPPLNAAGLISGLVDCRPSYEPQGPLLEVGQSSLADSTLMETDVPTLALEFGHEYLLRNRRDGLVVADIEDWSSRQSLFMPLTSRAQRTVLAVSSTSGAGDLYYDDPEIGSMLSWKSGSTGWAVSHSLGKLRLGLSANTSAGKLEGTSLYPQTIFEVLQGTADTGISIDTDDVTMQAVYRLHPDTKLQLTAGSAGSDYRLRFASAATDITIPMGTDAAHYGIAAERKLSGRSALSIGFKRSSGDGSDYIRLNGLDMGRLTSRTSYSEFDCAIGYRRSTRTNLHMGYVTSSRRLGLHGNNVRCKDLGIGLEPLNDKVDFDAEVRLSDRFYHIGMSRQLSERWSVDACYQRIWLVTGIEGDYVGRGFFGLVSSPGSFSYNPGKIRAHGLGLSLAYRQQPLTVILGLQQLVPERSVKISSGTDDVSKSSTGGTNLSLTCNYAF